MAPSDDDFIGLPHVKAEPDLAVRLRCHHNWVEPYGGAADLFNDVRFKQLLNFVFDFLTQVKGYPPHWL